MPTQLKTTAANRKFVDIPTVRKVETIIAWLTEKKALDLLALDLSKEHLLSEAVVIVTATSPRHAQGLADFVLEECRRQKMEYLRTEGYTAAQWILLDLNDVVVHIFQPSARDLYRLDDLWPSAGILADNRKEH